MRFRRLAGSRLALLAILSMEGLAARPAAAQWVQSSEQFYLQASHNWQFRDRYRNADGLFNAFDYGHAILYETLWTRPGAPASRLEQQEFDHLVNRVLVRPPSVPVAEEAVMVRYAQLAPEAKHMFDWAHVLHRQLYDVLADERLSAAGKDAEVARVIAFYRARRDLAFSARPKSMALMQEQPYSLAFRQRYPKFNGLIWAYHWLQVGLYEPLVVGVSPAEKQALVRGTVGRFFQMIARPVEGMPHQMPMTAAVAPGFTERYPQAAIIFDNLHSMHDVISDILANPSVPRDRKRAEILRAVRLFQDDTSYVMPVEAWRTMSRAMGIENMGGPSVGFLATLPTPSVTYGAVMTHDERSGMMTGFKVGSAVGDAHAGHDSAGSGQIPAAATPDSAIERHGATHGAVAQASDDSLAVAQVILSYHSALARGDSLAALALLTSDAMILESGGAETFAEYRAHHLASDIAFAQAVRETRSPIRVTVQGGAAWASSTSVAQGEFRGRPVDSTGAELMVLARGADGRWLIRAIHWSSRARRPAR